MLPDRGLSLHCQSIGDNCEFGLVPRNAGAEPLGLLRFAGVPVRHLIRALEHRFEGNAEPRHLHVQFEHHECMLRLARYDVLYHAFALEGDLDPAEPHQRAVRRIAYPNPTPTAATKPACA